MTKEPIEKRLSLDKIECSATFSRASRRTTLVKEYAERIEAGESSRQSIVFFDGETYWLAEGFHRLAGAQEGRPKADRLHRHHGSKEDAQWHALQSNQDHG